jgi:translation elongation factor P/translation initiation factor 5A
MGMKKLVAVGFWLTLAVAAAMAAGCATTSAKPGGMVLETVTATATVEAVDAAKRTVTLKFADGKTQTYKLGPEVKNFDQIKAGDRVKSTMVESVAVFVRKSDEPPGVAEGRTVQVAPKGAKPGALITDTVEVTAKVEAIDYQKRTVTLRQPNGAQKTFAVDKSVEKFNTVKTGDEVVLRVTDALLINVESP